MIIHATDLLCGPLRSPGRERKGCRGRVVEWVAAKRSRSATEGEGREASQQRARERRDAENRAGKRGKREWMSAEEETRCLKGGTRRGAQRDRRRRRQRTKKRRWRAGEEERDASASVSGRRVWACVTTRACRCKYGDRGLRVAPSRRVYRQPERERVREGQATIEWGRAEESFRGASRLGR